MVFGDRVGYGSFQEALTQVFGLSPTPSPSPTPGPTPSPGPTPNPQIRALVAAAQKAYTDAQAALKNPNGPDWVAYGAALGRLQTALNQLASAFRRRRHGESVAFGLPDARAVRAGAGEPGTVEPGAATSPAPAQAPAGDPAAASPRVGCVGGPGGGDRAGARGLRRRRAGASAAHPSVGSASVAVPPSVSFGSLAG